MIQGGFYMNQSKKISRKVISIVLSLLMLLSLIPSMSLTAYAVSDSYASYVGTTTTVKFNNIDWYVIEDNSTAVDEGSVTLLAANPIAASKFNAASDGYAYSNSIIKTYLDNLTAEGGSFADVAYAINSVDLDDVNVTGAKLYLLSKSEAMDMVSTELGKCTKDEAAETNFWWLRTPSIVASANLPVADGVSGDNGKITLYGGLVEGMYNVRPALQLDLSKVVFEDNTFKTVSSVTTAPTAEELTYNGTEQELVTAGEAKGGEMLYALGIDDTIVPAADNFTADIPTGDNATIYYVWYKVAGDDAHTDSEAECVTVSIANAELTVTARNKTIAYGDAIPQNWYFVKGLVDGDTVDVTLKPRIAENKIVFSLKASCNYEITMVSGLLGIKGAPTANALPSGKNIVVNFSTTKNADGYMIYAGYCGSGSYPLVKTIKGNDTHSYTLTKLDGKAIDQSKNVFLYVVAYKNVNGKKISLVRSASVRVAGANSKFTNAKSVTVKQSALTLKVGKTATISATANLVDAKKTLFTAYPELTYASSNKSVATVDKNGKITAVAKGTANIYAYTQNGKKAKVTVTVN